MAESRDVIKLHDGENDILYSKKCHKEDKSILTLKQNGILLGDTEYTMWQNHAEDMHRAIVGDDVYEDKVERQFKDAVEKNEGFLGGIGSRLAKTKMEFFHAQRLNHPDHECYPRPVGGAGFAKVTSNPKFPDHPYFKAGRVFSIRVRHNNLAFTDDAMLDARVVCVKFKDADSGGDLDLIMYTGRVPPYYNSASFNKYMEAFGDGDNGLKTWILGDPINYIGRVECIRRNPQSYYDQHYYSHVTYVVTSSNSHKYLARLRLLPAEDIEETGLPDKHDQENAWKVDRWPSDVYVSNYLRKEYKNRLRKAPLQYRLQIQTRSVDVTEPVDVNPCLIWSDQDFPWLDLVTLTVTHPLKQKVLAKTNIDLVVNPLPSFKPIEPQSMKDFASLVFVTREFHGVTANSQSELKADREKVNAIEIALTVKTGSMLNAGTDGDVYIMIIGSKRRTQPLYLATPFHDDFETGCTDLFNLTIPDIGDICAIKMELRSMVTTRQWYLEDVLVQTTTGSNTRFPCYQWLTHAQPTILLRPAAAILYYQEKHAYGILQRKLEIEERRRLYQWEKVEGLPGRIKCAKYENLPREVQFQAEKERDLMAKYIRTLTNSGVSAVTTLFDQSWDIMTDYDKILTNVLKDKKMVKRVAEVWKEDAEFGRQILNGANPTQIRRVTKFTDEMKAIEPEVRDLLDRKSGRGLDTEIFNGRVYVMDFPALSSMEKSRMYKDKYHRYISAPTCYLYVQNDHTLLPIAIKIPGDEKDLIFTPNDTAVDWLVAKMWVREADAQMHQVVERHLKTQLTIEAFAIATMRNLPSSHPVYKLLLPHLRYIIGINVLGRQCLYPGNEGIFEKLLAIGGQHMDLLKASYRSFDLSDLHLPNYIEDCGLQDENKLPNYYYREDGKMLWEAINKCVRTTVYLHYWTPENVRADTELQSWLDDLRLNGFPTWPGDTTDTHGLPDTFHNLDILIEILTTIIFTASARNAALTLGMMDYYSFVPNMPAMLLEPPPNEKGRLTMENVKRMLPSRGKTAEIIAACYTLSRFGKDEIFLGEYPEDYFDDETMKATFDAFKTDLDRIETFIRHRNATSEVPYTYLMPSSVPSSICM